MGEPACWEEVTDKKSKWMTFGLELDGRKVVEGMSDLQILPYKGETILELGFGYGRFINGYINIGGEASYIGIDINPYWVEYCKKKYGDYVDTEFIQGDILDPKLYTDIGKKFDLIVGLGIFGCMFPTFGDLLDILQGIIKPNGRIIFTLIERGKDQQRVDKYRKLYMRSYHEDESVKIIRERGWVVESSVLLKYDNGIHTRKMYVIKLKDAPARQLTPKRRKEGKEIGIFLDSLNRITGGHKRRVNMALELNRRGWDTALLLRNFVRSKEWNGIDLRPIRMEKYDPKKTKDWLMMGDDRFQFKEFCTSRTNRGKVWMFQGFRRAPGPELKETWQSPKITCLCFSTWMKELVEYMFHRPAIKAIGAVDPKFYYPNPEIQREKVILTTKVHWNEGVNTQVKDGITKILRDRGWRLDFFKGEEKDVREQLWRAGMVLSLRGDRGGYVFRDWNNPIAEGMATRTPTILLRTGGTGDIAIHKKTAYVIPVQNELGEELSTKLEDILGGIEWMIDHEKERSQIANGGSRHILKFTYKKMVDVIEREILNAVG